MRRGGGKAVVPLGLRRVNQTTVIAPGSPEGSRPRIERGAVLSKWGGKKPGVLHAGRAYVSRLDSSEDEQEGGGESHPSDPHTHADALHGTTSPMPTTVAHDVVAPILIAEYDALSALCERFADEDWATPTCLPGWTVKDVLSHIIGTESMLLGEPAPAVDVSGYDHVRNPTAQFNEAWVESLRAVPGAEVLEQFRDVTAKRSETLRSMTQADFDAPSWTPVSPDETYGRFMRIRHFDCYLHELDIRAAVGAADREDPAHVHLAVREPLSALGYIVGKKAGLPRGTTVSVRLMGPANETHHVVVEDKARIVETLDSQPTTAIALSAVLFLRLTGGRVDPMPYIGDSIVFEGDHELAARLATNLAFTI